MPDGARNEKNLKALRLRKTLVRKAPIGIGAVSLALVASPLLEKTLAIERITFKSKKNFNCFSAAFRTQTLQTKHLIDIAYRKVHNLLAQTQYPLAFRAKCQHCVQARFNIDFDFDIFVQMLEKTPERSAGKLPESYRKTYGELPENCGRTAGDLPENWYCSTLQS